MFTPLKPERRQLEKRLLAHFFPKFRLHQNTAIGTLQTNSHSLYYVAVDLRLFPLQEPVVKVVSPRLRDAFGDLLIDRPSSMRMHHLGPDEHGSLKLCLHVPGDHDPRDTLYKSILKARIWLEAYEAHLRTGDPIDELLNHGNIEP